MKRKDITEELRPNVVLVPLFLLLLIWTVYYVEVAFGHNFNTWGIAPRSVMGLRGIIFSPFIHGSLSHLYHNTIPLAVLTAMLFYFYRKTAWPVLLWGIVFSGLITWGIGRDSYHIGASGLIYVLASFIFFKGVFLGYFRLVALSLIIVFLYGSMLWYIFPVKDGISWEGHLAGFLVGLFLALYTKNAIDRPEGYAWEQEGYNEEEDPFLKHFDEAGNFIPEHQLMEREAASANPEETEIKVNYIFKKSEDGDTKA